MTATQRAARARELGASHESGESFVADPNDDMLRAHALRLYADVLDPGDEVLQRVAQTIGERRGAAEPSPLDHEVASVTLSALRTLYEKE